jgi:Flp pilus assembly protein TadD
LKPTWRELHSNLGFACVQLGRVEEAASHYHEALALDPNYLPTCIALAELALRRGDREEARRVLQHALTLDPDHAPAKALWQRASAP